ncbi:hypothetical protein [Enterococcus phage vB_EfaH_149]|uniref:Uncharacterized protein n=1 Tax=Enterococcus phage vB_EfaH_149 TaxID=2730535 RepID=A0ACA9ATV0_9CAUD|nr:hypothetical protein [Enterococcus phage vB_EfaH_149]CAD0300903.1 hypothetical protein [Enterococcus phage 156]VDB76924.1 hypothetical protein PHI156_135 [Enterococcus phage 156]
MKMSKREYEKIKESLTVFGVEKITAYKKQLEELHASGESNIKNVETRLIFEVYYACVPNELRMGITENDNYNDAHIETAVRKALKELKVLK